MRRGIGLRGYAQQDPLNEFRKEAFQLYGELRGLIRHQVAIDDLPGHRDPDPAPGQSALEQSLAAGARALAGAAAGGAAAGGGRRRVGDGGSRATSAAVRRAAGAGGAARSRSARSSAAACRATRWPAPGSSGGNGRQRAGRPGQAGLHPDRRPDRPERSMLVRLGPEVQEVSRPLSRRRPRRLAHRRPGRARA